MEFERAVQTFSQGYQLRKGLVQNINVAAIKAKGDRRRREFLEMACLEPPSQVRLINCHSSCEENQVVLIDWCKDQAVEYAAISHTFGMEVYGVFDCECTTKCLTKVPRCLKKPCPGHAADSDPRNRVVKDILNMCAILRSAGVEYAWHDGVCIAQHNVDEVEDTIKHIGWIYSHARETIIFLHYVGAPMAPISLDGDFQSRWQTRVWTLQEAALSKHRRYCMRVGTSGETTALGACKSLQEFEDKIARFYKDEYSKVAVIEEEAYWKIIMELYTLIIPFCSALLSGTDRQTLATHDKVWAWFNCVTNWVQTLIHTCFRFPSVAVALRFCSDRDSKHQGDRINSILTLAGVKDFVAHKDDGVEASTVEFFKRQGQQGLARAVFTANVGTLTADMNEYGKRRHTWLPILSSHLTTVYELLEDVAGTAEIEGQVENFIQFTVLDDGKLELRGEMVCVPVKFTYLSNIGRPVQDQSPPKSGPLKVMRDSCEPNLSMAMNLAFDLQGFQSTLAQASSMALGTTVVPIILEDHGKRPVEAVSSCTAACRWAGEILGRIGRASLSCCGCHTSTPNDALDTALAELELNGTLARAISNVDPGWMAAVPHSLATSGASTQSIATGAAASAASPQLTQVPALNLGSAIFPILPPNVGSGRFGPLVQERQIQDGESFWAHMVLPLPALLQYEAFVSSQQAPSGQVLADWDYKVPAVLVQGDLNAEISKIGCFLPHRNLREIFLMLLVTLPKIHKLTII